jgi:hypothetical protein
VSDCPNITDFSVLHVVAACGSRLEYIGTMGTRVTDALLIAVAYGCTMFSTGHQSTSFNRRPRHLQKTKRDNRDVFLFGMELRDPLSMKLIAYRSPELLDLSLCVNKDITDDILLCVFRFCPKLESLRLLNNGKLSGAVVAAMTGCFPSLHTLTVNRLSGLNDAVMTPFLASHRHLVKLAVSLCPLLSDDTLYAVAENCVALQELDVCGDVLITCRGIVQVLIKCVALIALDVSSCPLVDKHIFSHVRKHGANLNLLHVNACPLISVNHLLGFTFTDNLLSELRCGSAQRFPVCLRRKGEHFFGEEGFDEHINDLEQAENDDEIIDDDE